MCPCQKLGPLLTAPTDWTNYAGFSAQPRVINKLTHKQLVTAKLDAYLPEGKYAFMQVF